MASNPDQALIRAVQRHPDAPCSMNASPMALALGGAIVSADERAGLIELAFEPGETFIQGAGVLQGGAVASMLDFAMGFVGLMLVPDGTSVATANLNISFLKAARIGHYRSRGSLERRGRSLIFARAQLTGPGGDVVASGTSTLLVVPWQAPKPEGQI